MMVRVYCLMVPIALVSNLGLLTPVASAALSVMFILLDAIGREIENPFENTVHDTPMSGLSRTIEINLRQNLRDRSLPRDIRPVQGFVY
jgi:putative membrane protein